jgi:hypothetical protein
MPFSKKACGWRLFYKQISPGHIWTILYVGQWFAAATAAAEDVKQTVHNLMYTVNIKLQYFYTF